ncbi:type II secretion system F family protein [Agrobacterium sp. S2]|nr:type II secretion system F family protein [Agrobacterium sp. S2]
MMKWAAIPLAVLAGVVGWWWSRHKNDLAVRERVDPVKLKVPVFGPLFSKVAIARFSRNFGTMIRAGVPLLQALDIVGDTSGNIVVSHAVKDVRDSVRTGQSLTGPLAQHKVFPPMVVQMMAVGEDTGALDTMLDKIADFYDQEVEATTEQLTSLIEPIMIVGIGAIIGGMIVSLYMPIFSIYGAIQ